MLAGQGEQRRLPSRFEKNPRGHACGSLQAPHHVKTGQLQVLHLPVQLHKKMPQLNQIWQTRKTYRVAANGQWLPTGHCMHDADLDAFANVPGLLQSSQET